MDQTQLTEHISQRNKISIGESENLLNSTVSELLDELLREKNADLPGLGNLEIKVIPGRKTVFFKFLPDRSLSKEASISVFGTITELLYQGQTITLPSIGIFQPVINENGICTRVSFILSPMLRSRLNNERSVNNNLLEKIRDKAPEDTSENKQQQQEEPISKVTGNEVIEDITELIPEVESIEDVVEIAPVAKAREVHAKRTPVNESKTNKNTSNETFVTEKIPVGKESGVTKKIILLVLSIILLVTVYVIFNKFQIDDPEIKEPTLPNLAIKQIPSLLDVSTEHYGNPAFWVYIYDANQDKLTSPLTIPINTELIIPDLKAAYNVDMNDSLEIVRANMIAENILKKYKQKEY